ncbi:hypothetical protein LEP1GSC161_2498 [Leptospira santarosai str. CBC1416]|uniref:Uncharacterized protein n=1 Tax=Leptospira santarosai str. CBC1416 TaxID=1193059 RepID=M6VJ96_9LEPT|nr:hypothetical protein LEP1GSC161_2498 [Leptospira santarosai str. CBC1416]EPG81944.1 hypothetical protein LEP1GSC048_0298 [Leptospira santarosai serovar Shermani str. 1342KT]
MFRDPRIDDGACLLEEILSPSFSFFFNFLLEFRCGFFRESSAKVFHGGRVRVLKPEE